MVVCFDLGTIDFSTIEPTKYTFVELITLFFLEKNQVMNDYIHICTCITDIYMYYSNDNNKCTHKKNAPAVIMMHIYKKLATIKPTNI